MQAASAAKLDASSLRIGVAVSRYHREITDALLDGAKKSFSKAGGKKKNLEVVESPGAWELTVICASMAWAADASGKPRYDAIVALGCVLTGETTHDQYIAQSVTQGLTQITLETGTPIAFGVLTCRTLEQARERKSKGIEAMQAAIAAVHAIAPFKDAAENAL